MYIYLRCLNNFVRMPEIDGVNVELIGNITQLRFVISRYTFSVSFFLFCLYPRKHLLKTAEHSHTVRFSIFAHISKCIC